MRVPRAAALLLVMAVGAQILAGCSDMCGCTPGPSPDYGHIAFISQRAGSQGIFRMVGDGSSVTRVTSSPPAATEPAWSPDALLIAFCGVPEGGGDSAIYVVDRKGTTPPTKLTDNPGQHDRSPAWSASTSDYPAGRIAFCREQGSNGAICVMKADGSDLHTITSNLAYDGYPSWSPDGSKIAFASNRDGDWEIYVMNADGSEQTRITSSPGVDTSPAWSRDGARIAFVSERDGNQEIYLMSADGTGPVNLTNNPAQDCHPAWCPFDINIAFATNRDGNWEIYAMRADGSSPHNLTNNAAEDEDPDWVR